MSDDPHARAFAELFPAVFARFCRRWTPREYRPSAEATGILEHLADTGPLTVSEAAAHFDRSQAATSELLARLERRGLVERVPDERDQRRHLVWLTKPGRALVEDIRRVLEPGRLAAAFARMKAGERRALVDNMRALLRAADELKPAKKKKTTRKTKGRK